ncbi:MAG: hypothetical protein VKK42_06215 [Lyngbya sp.]|nr:hypothetical protein [Lyngbya sp.]
MDKKPGCCEKPGFWVFLGVGHLQKWLETSPRPNSALKTPRRDSLVIVMSR